MPAAVILVHGLRTSATLWRHQVEELTVAGIPVIAIDLPGHGTRMSERFTLAGALEAIGDAVTEATGATGVAPYLVGFSLGGYLSIEWVATHPGSVSGLLAASCGTVPGRVILGGWRLLALGIHTFPDRGRSLNDFVVRLFVPSPGAEDVIAGGVALEVMDDVLRELIALRPVQALRSIDVPVLFVNGRFDHIRWHARRYLVATPNGRVITVAGSTHMVSVVRPREFTEALLAGYAEATATPASRRLPDGASDW